MKIGIINNISFKNNNSAVSIKSMSNPQPLSDSQKDSAIPLNKLANTYIGYNLIDKYLGYRKIAETKLPFLDNPAVTYQAANGDKYIILQRNGICSVSVKVPTPDSSETFAVKHSTEHLIFADNSNHSYIKELNDLNIIHLAECSENEANYSFWGNSDKKDFKKLLQIISNMFGDRTFSQDELSKEKKILLNEEAIKSSETEKKYFLSNIVKGITEQNNQASKEELKYQDALEKLTPNDVEKFYNKYYKNQCKTTVIASPFPPDEVMKEVAKYIDKKTVKNEYSDVSLNISKPKEINIVNKDSKDSCVSVSFLIPNTVSDMNSYLISNFIADYIQDRKYLEDTDADEPYFKVIKQKINKDFNSLSIFCSSDKKNTETVKKKIFSIISNLANKQNLQKEFENYKLYQKDTLSKIAEHNHTITKALLEDYFFSKDTLYKCDSLNINDVKIYISKYLDENKAYTITDEGMNKKNISFCGNKNYENLVYPNNLLMSLNKDYNTKRAAYGVELTTKSNLNKSPVLAKLLEKMIENEIQKDGLNIKIKSNLQAIYAGMDCITDRMIEGINKTNDFLYRFKITPEKFEKAKQKILSECTIHKSLMPNQDFKKLIFGINPNFQTYEEEIKDLNKITISDLRDFYLNFLNQSQAVASLNINKKFFDNNKASIFNLIGNNNVKFRPYETIDWGEKFKVPPLKNNHIIFNHSNEDTSLVQKAYRFPKAENSDDFVALSVVKSLLNKKLFKKIRTEEQLSYKLGVHSLYENKCNNMEVIEIFAETKKDIKNENLKKLYTKINKVINEFKTNPGTQEEIDKLKNDLRLLFSPDIPSRLKMKNGLLQLQSPYKNNYFQVYEKAIDNLNIEKIKNAASYILNANSVTQIYSTKDAFDKIRPLLNGEIHENK